MSDFLTRGCNQFTALIRDDLLGADAWRTHPARAALLPYGWTLGTARALKLVGRHALYMSALTVNAAAFLLHREKAGPLPTTSTDPKERFAVAQQSYGVAEDWVRQAVSNTHSTFLIYIAAALVVTSVELAFGRAALPTLPWWLDVAWRASLPCVALCLAFKVAMANWQMRNRRLGGVIEFLRQPGEWWTEPDPHVPPRGTRGAKVAMSIGLLLGLGTLSAPAVEAATGSTVDVNTLFSTANLTNDLWFKLLGYVFPGIGPLSAANTSTNLVSNGIASGFGAFAACLMAVAAGMMSYQTIAGTIATAQSGKVLGDKWNLFWAPARISFGFASLVPMSSGYCLLQIAVIWGAIISGQIGNVIWSSFLGALDSSTISKPYLEQTMPLVRDTFGMELCLAAVQREQSVTGNTQTTRPSDQPVQGATEGGVISTPWWWFKNLTSGGAATAGTASPSQVATYTWDYGPCGTITAKYTVSGGDSGVSGMDSARRQAVNNLRNSLKDVATTIVQATSPGTGRSILTDMPTSFNDVASAKTAYDSAITAAASSYAAATNETSLSDFQTAAKSAGWVSAGPYYIAISRLDAQYYAYLGEQPKVNFPYASVGDLMKDPRVTSLLGTDGASTLQAAVTWWDKNVAASSSLNPDAARAGLYNTSGTVINFIQRNAFSADGPFQKWLLGMMTITPGRGDALRQLIGFGNMLVNVIEIGFGLFLGLSAIVGAIGLTPAGQVAGGAAKAAGWASHLVSGGSSALNQLGGFAMLFAGMIALSILSVGVFFAFILPMLPFLHFLYAVMDIMVIVIIGVVAAPIWAFMHIRMDGQEFHDGPQRAGYMMFFNLLFRIPLTLFGLFFSLIVLEAMAWLMAVTLFPAMIAATSDSFFGLIGMITYLVLIGVVNYQIATRSFNLITQLPERVVAWFGASPDHGEAQQHTERAMGFIGVHTQQGLGAMGQAAQGTMLKGALGRRSGGKMPGEPKEEEKT